MQKIQIFESYSDVVGSNFNLPAAAVPIVPSMMASSMGMTALGDGSAQLQMGGNMMPGMVNVLFEMINWISGHLFGMGIAILQDKKINNYFIQPLLAIFSHQKLLYM